MRKKGQSGMGFLLSVIIALFIIGFLTTIFVLMVSNLSENGLNSGVTDYLLILTSGTLSHQLSSASSVTALNQTWLNLDGVNEYINVSDQDYFSINNATGDFTFSLWLKIPNWEFNGTDGSTGYIEAIGKGRTAWSNPEWGIRIYNSSNTAGRPCRISFYVWNLTGGEGAGAYIQRNATATSCLPEVTDTWFNLVGSVNESRVILWLNGNKNTPSTGDLLDTYGIKAGMGNGDSAVRFGTRQVTGFIDGSIDEIRIWNRTLTAGEVSALNSSGRFQNTSINSTNLVLWLRLNENTGTTAYDVSGLGNNGLIIGGASYENDAVTLPLSEGTDYSISGTTLTLLTTTFSWSRLTVIYDSGELSNSILDALADIPAWFGVIITVAVMVALILMTVLIIRAIRDSGLLSSG